MLLAISSLEIKSYQGVSDIQLGTEISQIHEALGNPDSSFYKSETSKYPTDAYDRLGIYVFYRSPGVCAAIELCEPAEPTFQSQKLLGRPFDEVKKFFQSIDPNLKLDDTGFTSYTFGIGVYAPFVLDDPSDPVESVIIFERGYYS